MRKIEMRNTYKFWNKALDSEGNLSTLSMYEVLPENYNLQVSKLISRGYSKVSDYRYQKGRLLVIIR